MSAIQVAPRAHQARRVLVIEDDPELREVFADTLRRQGHDVVTATDGLDGLRQMRASRPDLVLLDLVMPVMDGFQFRLEQRRDPALAATPVVAMSARDDAAARAIDADLYLQKPIAAGALLDAVEEVMLAHEHRHGSIERAQSERLASLGALAAGIAHEINNPLTYVLLNLSRAAQIASPLRAGEAAGADADQLAPLIEGVIEGAKRIQGIVKDVRTFSRVDDIGRAPIEVGVVLGAAIRIAVHEVRQRARLQTELRPTPRVLANEGRLGQAFLNLIMNAVHAIPEGNAAENEIRIETSIDDGGWVVVDVSDTGRGIPERIRGRVFEPFFSTKPVGEGTGLGLSICHGIITGLGGEVNVFSEVGRGTTFRVRLPPAPTGSDMPAPPSPDPVESPRPDRRLRVLIVDDDPLVARAIRRELEGQHDAVIAGTGRDALALLGSGATFDVILCDLHMPDVSGMELEEVLRQSRPELVSRMIFMTAGAFSERARALLESTSSPVLWKPIDPAQLRAVLADVPAREP